MPPRRGYQEGDRPNLPRTHHPPPDPITTHPPPPRETQPALGEINQEEDGVPKQINFSSKATPTEQHRPRPPSNHVSKYLFVKKSRIAVETSHKGEHLPSNHLSKTE
ncbi:putative pectinesterase [Trifolium repens]|nr:putative pectinesterase [Trifolium repens]